MRGRAGPGGPELCGRGVRAGTGAGIVQDTGDGCLARFATVKAAVEAALRFQHAVRSEPWREQPIQVREGLHLGDVAATGKISALAVDLASRVMGLAMPGQILMTRAVFDDARQHVREHPGADNQDGARELRWMAHGPYLFKGNDEPMEICEVGVERISPLRPPPDSEKAERVIKAGDEQRYGLRPAVAQPVPQNENWILQSKIGQDDWGEAWFATDTRTGASREFRRHAPVVTGVDAWRAGLESDVAVDGIGEQRVGVDVATRRILPGRLHDDAVVREHGLAVKPQLRGDEVADNPPRAEAGGHVVPFHRGVTAGVASAPQAAPARRITPASRRLNPVSCDSPSGSKFGADVGPFWAPITSGPRPPRPIASHRPLIPTQKEPPQP